LISCGLLIIIVSCLRNIKIHIIPALLACIIVLPLLFSGGLQLFQVYLKHRAEHRLQNEQLQAIRFPLHSVKWVEEDREIMVDGQMYDLSSYVEQDGWLIGKGVHDEKETQVMALLNNFNEKEQDKAIMQLLLFSQFFIAIVSLSFSFRFDIKRSINFIFYLPSYTNPFLKSFFQPPRAFMFAY
jgi:hypothetical protein